MQLTRLILLFLIACSLCFTSGCTTIPSWANYPPFVEVDRTSYNTPQMRIDAIREFATRSSGVDSPEQRELADQLARQIQIEPDPLVRVAIIETISKFRTELALQVLQAGLNDTDQSVQIASCQGLGTQANPAAVQTLASKLQSNKSIDVRLAAAEALANIQSPDSIQALALAVNDRDPALQYVGANSLKTLSGRDYGGDINAWRQFAAGQSPPEVERELSLAERVKATNPFQSR